MKRAVFYLLFVMVVGFGFVSCFASKFIEEKLLESVDIESMLFSNYEKTMEAREKMMDELLAVFEKNGNIVRVAEKRVRGENVSFEEKERILNGYFDSVDSMETTSTAVEGMQAEVDAIGGKYEEALSVDNGTVLQDEKAIEGVEESGENIIIGGDMFINKNIPENTLAVVNMLRSSQGTPLLKEDEVKKRGFYCSQSAFMWSNTKWKDGKVKYRIAGSINAKQEKIIMDCMNIWSEASGGKIKFIRYKNSFWNKFRWKYMLSRHLQISIDKGISNSWATLGQQVRAQIHIDEEYLQIRSDNTFVFDEEVIKSEILHEMGHVLTLFHEHQRADRDKYVKVNYERAAKVNGWSEDKAVAQYGRVTMYEQMTSADYDYDSIMHYWSSNADEYGERDIVRSDGTVISRAMSLSEKDKKFIEELYGEQ